MRNDFAHFLSLLLLPLLIVGCSNYSGTLSVVGQIPAPGATNVSVKDNIEVVFSEPVKPETINEKTVLLANEQNVIPRQVYLSSDGRKLIVKMQGPFLPPAKIHLTLTDGIQNLSGGLLTPVNWEWKVPDWQQIAFIPTGNVGGSSFFLDNSRNPVAIYPISAYSRDWDGSLYLWDGKRLVKTNSMDTKPQNSITFFESLHFDRENNPIVIFTKYQGSNLHQRPYRGNILRAVKWNGKEWIQLGSDLNAIWKDYSSLGCISSELDPTGNLTVLWNEYGNLYLKRWNSANWDQLGDKIQQDTDLNVNVSKTVYHCSVLGFGKDGDPIVSFAVENYYSESSMKSYSASVKHWNGKNWVDLAENVQTEDEVWGFKLNKNNFPTIGLRNKNSIYLKQWNGSSWIKSDETELGNSYYDFSFAFDSKGNPLICYVKTSFATQKASLVLKQWDGKQWTPFTEESRFVNERFQDVALDEFDNPVAILSDGGFIKARRWNRNSWENLGGIIAEGQASHGRILLFDQNELFIETRVAPIPPTPTFDGYPFITHLYRWNGLR